MPTPTNEFATVSDALSGMEPWRGVVRRGFTADFMGVMTEVKFNDFAPEERPESQAPYQAAAEPPTMIDGEPYFEWLDVLAAVSEAEGRFVMIELGGGYAARSVGAHAALRRFNPLPATFVVVEPEPTHFAWAKAHFANNGLDWRRHWFINAAVSDSNTPVLFPIGEGLFSNTIVREESAAKLLNSIVEQGAAETVLRNLVDTCRLGVSSEDTNGKDTTTYDFEFVSTVTLDDILAPLDRVDYLDVDIQKAERVVLPAAIEHLNEKVKRLHVGTHSQEHRTDIHGELERLFAEHGWEFVFNFEPHTKYVTDRVTFTTSDGILSLKNPRLA